MEATDYIPRENFNLWYSLFKVSPGRLIGNPIDGRRRVYVRYTFDDIESYNEMMTSYRWLTMPIVETKRGYWKSLRIKFGFRLGL